MKQNLAEGNLMKLILQFSIPAIVGQLVFALYNIVDRMFIGQTLGTMAISSISVTLPLFTIMIAFGMLVGIGAASRVSIALGQGNKDRAEKILGNAMFLYLIINAIIMFFGYMFMEDILIYMGATDAMLEMATSYMNIIYFMVIFNMMGMGLNSIIRAEGAPKIAMYVMLSGAILNIILDYFFVIVFNWGVEGAAVATKISAFVSACLTLYHFTKRKNRVLTLRWINLKPDWEIIKSILSIGFAGFFLQLSISLTVAFSNTQLKEYGGEMAIGAMGVISAVYMAVMMINIGLGQGVQPLIGFNHGHKSYDRVRGLLKRALILGTSISMLVFIPMIIFPEHIIGLFTNGDKAFIEMCTRGMYFYMMGLPFVGFCVIGSGYYQAVGKPKQSGILFLLKYLVFFMGALLILPHYMQLDGVFFSCSVSDFMLFICVLIFLTKEIKELRAAEAYEANLKMNPLPLSAK
ncbi:MAG: MATE family efflux transporter [Marinifilaceae bacterium]